MHHLPDSRLPAKIRLRGRLRAGGPRAQLVRPKNGRKQKGHYTLRYRTAQQEQVYISTRTSRVAVARRRGETIVMLLRQGRSREEVEAWLEHDEQGDHTDWVATRIPVHAGVTAGDVLDAYAGHRLPPGRADVLPNERAARTQALLWIAGVSIYHHCRIPPTTRLSDALRRRVPLSWMSRAVYTAWRRATENSKGERASHARRNRQMYYRLRGLFAPDFVVPAGIVLPGALLELLRTPLESASPPAPCVLPSDNVVRAVHTTIARAVAARAPHAWVYLAVYFALFRCRELIEGMPVISSRRRTLIPPPILAYVEQHAPPSDVGGSQAKVHLHAARQELAAIIPATQAQPLHTLYDLGAILALAELGCCGRLAEAIEAKSVDYMVNRYSPALDRLPKAKVKKLRQKIVHYANAR